MTETKTASQTLKDTFNSVYHAWINYCEMVLYNQMALDIHNKLRGYKEPTYYDEGLVEMNLTMEF